MDSSNIRKRTKNNNSAKQCRQRQTNKIKELTQEAKKQIEINKQLKSILRQIGLACKLNGNYHGNRPLTWN